MRTGSGRSAQHRALPLVLGLLIALGGLALVTQERVRAQGTTGFLEIEAFDDLWPSAIAVCTGPVSDADPEGTPVIVSLVETNVAEAPVGDCEVSWTNPSGAETRIGVTVEADRVTWIRGSVIAFPQGAGETYRVTDEGGTRIWEAPFETGNRIWVLPGLYEVELSARTGDPILVWAELDTLPGTVTTIHAGTEP
jgi:hypothetical protein